MHGNIVSQENGNRLFEDATILITGGTGPLGTGLLKKR